MSSWHQHYTPEASLERNMSSKMSEPCTRPTPNPAQGLPKSSCPHSHHQAVTKHAPPPRRAGPGPHNTHHATPPTAAKHHGNHHRSEHRKAQRTANPNPRTKINPEVQSSRDTCPDSVRHDHRTRDTPTIGRVTRQARNSPHTTAKHSGQKRHTNTMAARN